MKCQLADLTAAGLSVPERVECYLHLLPSSRDDNPGLDYYKNQARQSLISALGSLSVPEQSNPIAVMLQLGTMPKNVVGPLFGRLALFLSEQGYRVSFDPIQFPRAA